MILHNIDQISERAKALPKARRVVVADAEHIHTVEAILTAAKDGFIEPYLVGKKDKIKELVTQKHGCLTEDQYIDVPSGAAQEISDRAVELIREGRADFILKGGVNTSDILRAVLNKEHGLPHQEVVTAISLNEIPGVPKLVGFCDAGILPYPTLEQRAAQIKLAGQFMKGLGYDEKIKIAVISSSENINRKISDSAEAAALKEMYLNGSFPGCEVEGPISLDLALLEESAVVKKYDSPVAGKADVLLFPNLVAGNVCSKMLLICTKGHNRSVSTALGVSVPIVITSRAASVDTKYHSLALGAILVKEMS